MEIIIDTESTGLTRLSYANNLNYKQWPRLLQLAWAIVADGKIIERRDMLIQPIDFTIPAKATQIHGITQEQASNEGIPITAALKEVQQAFQKCDRVIAHNLNYDLGILESEALRLDRRLELPTERTCTVHWGRKYLVQMRGIRQGGYPKLSQLYENLFGFTYPNAHDAAGDVTACFHVYKKLKTLGF
ncbi:MAG: exonuclease domain-containing protein [Opitutales bacterium]